MDTTESERKYTEDEAKAEAIEHLVIANDKHEYYAYNSKEQEDIERVVEIAVEYGMAVANDNSNN